MQLPEFIFFEMPAFPGAGFIMQLQPPYYIGKVYKFRTDDELNDFAAKQKANGLFIAAKPYDYRIIINHFTTLEKPLPMRNNKDADIVAGIYRRMADFYLLNKIQPHAAAFKRYKE